MSLRSNMRDANFNNAVYPVRYPGIDHLPRESTPVRSVIMRRGRGYPQIYHLPCAEENLSQETVIALIKVPIRQIISDGLRNSSHGSNKMGKWKEKVTFEVFSKNNVNFLILRATYILFSFFACFVMLVHKSTTYVDIVSHFAFLVCF